MPIHNWKRIVAGAFHHFHQGGAVRLADSLNAGILPRGYTAEFEQVTSVNEPDVPTLKTSDHNQSMVSSAPEEAGGLLVAEAPPQMEFECETELSRYAAKADRIAIRRVNSRRLISVTEVFSPGNKHSEQAIDRLKTRYFDSPTRVTISR